MAYIYALGAANGLVLTVLLLMSAKQSSANRVMALWCFLLSLSFFGNILHAQTHISGLSFLIGWAYYLPAAYGGLLFLYCQKLLQGSIFKATDWIHLLPLLLCYALSIDVLLASPEQKLVYIHSLPPQTPSFFITQFILFAQGFIYGFMSIRLVIQYKKHYKQEFSNVHKGLLTWMMGLIALSMIIWMSKLAPVVFTVAYGLPQFGSLLIVLLIYCVGFMQWHRPNWFITERLELLQPSPTVLKPPQTLKDSQTKIENSALDEQTRAAFAKVLTNTLEKQALYLQANLSLKDLSAQTNISVHHISETLNQYLHKNFYRFINEYRIKYFCELLANNAKATITELALQAGFVNKSTFNAAFKEIMQQTPSDYRKKIGMNKPNHPSDII